MSAEVNHESKRYIRVPGCAAGLYPHTPFSFSHHLSREPLLSINALIEAAKRLPPDMIECVTPKNTGLSLIELIKNIKTSQSWLIFRNLEQFPRYERLMDAIIQDLIRCQLLTKGEYCHPMCFAFLSSPSLKTPFHIDPEHNFLIQIAGTKVVRINNHGRNPIISGKEICDFYKDEVGYVLKYDEGYASSLDSFNLDASTGVYIPVAYPHLVDNGPKVSVSFSVTFRTELSENYRLRHLAKT